MQIEIVPILIYIASAVGLAVFLLLLGNLLNPRRPGPVKRMPYESGMDPLHDTRRRFDVRFHLMAIAFLVFDVELLFLYPWAVAIHRPRQPASGAAGVALDEGSMAAPLGTGHTAARRASDPAAEAGASAGAAAIVAGHTARKEAASVRPSGGSRAGTLAGGGIRPAFVGGLIFVGLLVLGLVYDWKKGVFQWR